MTQVTEADRERARRINHDLSAATTFDEAVEILAQSYAEVREEAEKEGDKEGLFFASRAFRAGMEEAARISDGCRPSCTCDEAYTSRKLTDPNCYACNTDDPGEAIRAAMKEGKP